MKAAGNNAELQAKVKQAFDDLDLQAEKAAKEQAK